MYFFSIANPNPFEWLNQLSHPYRDEEQQAQLLKLLNDLAMIFLKAAHEEIQKFRFILYVRGCGETFRSR